MATVESVAPTIDIEALLQPISEENPAGNSLQYDPVYSDLREARRFDDPSLSQGEWQTDLKVADYRQVVNLATAALTTQSKDLQISIWLTEALTNQHGFVGLRDGLQLITRLEDAFWGTMFPEIDEGDMEARANAIEWLDTQMALAVKKIPITLGNRYNYNQWNDSTQFEFPEDVESLTYDEREKVNALKQQAEDEKKVTGEMWRVAKAATNRQFYETLNLSLNECLTALTELDKKNEELFDSNQLPAVRNLQKSLNEVGLQITKLVEEKRLLEPDDEEEVAEVTTTNEEGETVVVKGNAVATGAIQSRQDALKRLNDIAEYFRKTEPNSPLSPLIQRAIKWGNMSFDALVKDMISEESVHYQIRQTLGFNTGGENSNSNEE